MLAAAIFTTLIFGAAGAKAAPFATAAVAAAAAVAALTVAKSCCADSGVTPGVVPFGDFPVTVLDCFLLEEVVPDPELAELEPLEPDEFEPEPDEPEPVEPEPLPDDVPEPVEPELLPDDELEPLPLEDTLPAMTMVFANKFTPPVLPPELVIDPLALIV